MSPRAPDMKKATAEELDRLFDESSDEIDEYIDWSQKRWPGMAELTRAARRATGLTQKAFAERYGLPLSTLRDWEQGKRKPDAAAQNYLRLIAQDPDAIAKLLDEAAA